MKADRNIENLRRIISQHFPLFFEQHAVDQKLNEIKQQLHSEYDWAKELRKLVEHPACKDVRGEARNGWDIVKDALDKLNKRN